MWNRALWAGLGLLAGLLVSVLADLAPYGLQAGRRCPRCGLERTWRDYGFNLRPCPRCGYRPRRPWVLLFLTAGLTVLLRFTNTKVPFEWLWPLTVYFLLLAVIDWEHRLILADLLLVGLVYGGALGIVRRGWGPTVGGALAGAGLMLLFYGLGRLLQTRLGADEEPLGFGDVLLMAVLGAVLGWPGVVAGLIWGILLAGVFSVALLAVCALRRRGWVGRAYVPYAPFLLLAAWLLLV